jgi:hypothetical protein
MPACSNCSEPFENEVGGRQYKQCPICRGLMREYSRRRMEGNRALHNEKVRANRQRQKLAQEGFEAAIRKVRIPADPVEVRRFREESCEDDIRSFITAKDFYQRYSYWCIKNHITPLKQRDALEAFAGKSYMISQGSGISRGKRVNGLRWKSERHE